MCDSILVFDEAHLMPINYLQPCLRGIVFITKYLNSEAVFLTATMPDFSKLIRQYALRSSKIVDLVEDQSQFYLFRKCRYQRLENISEEHLLEASEKCPTSLIVVNKKKTAKELYKKCAGKKYHLSTYMTAYDRKKIIEKIRCELKQLEIDFPEYKNVPKERRITVISTSLIEAGVHLDFFSVFRELAGLDNILQSGGRCNREGKRKMADVFIFDFDEENKSRQDVRVNLTKGIMERYEDISCLEAIKEYYERLFNMNKDEITEKAISNQCQNIRNIPFADYARDFEIIESKTVALAVPRDDESRNIIKSLKYTGGVAASRRLQRYTCSIYQDELDELLRQHAVDDYGTGIWCLTNEDYYDKDTGITFEAKDYFI